MKIGIDARWIFPEITGIGSYTQELIRHLAAVDRNNDYILFFQNTRVRDRTVAYAQLEDAPRMEARIAPFGPFSLQNQLRMPGIIRDAQLDLFHSTNFMLPFSACPRDRQGRTACVVTIHDLIPLIFPEHTPRALKSRFHFIYRAVMREVGRRADLIITVSESSRRDILHHMTIPEERRNKVIAIHEGVSDRYTPGSPPSGACPTILYVGRLDPYKNVPALIRAFSRALKSGRIQARLKIIGPRDARYPEVERLISEKELHPHIDWPGYVDADELCRAYREATVFVLPSLYEGFGLPVLEAMACGTPVICGNRASLEEVAGDAAILFDPQNEDALAAALESVLTDPARAETLRVKGLHRAAQFSWETTARKTIEAYEQCAVQSGE